MTIEITDISLDEEHVVTIEGIDVSEEHLQRLERIRDDGFERELTFRIDTAGPENRTSRKYFHTWIHRQKATKSCSTYGEALRAVVGTVTTISGKYLILE